ncbi:hypothetical protein EDB89DRAFT_1596612 [Lactarius sanguifluus]|nr:hypothetical protein EDB89DRAFT_1596612 [Lactarius sanguifluus]
MPTVDRCPFIHTIHFPASAFAWTHDSPVDSFVNPLKPWKTRTRCRACGVTVSSHNSKTDRISVWGPHLARDDSGHILRWAELRPTAHIFYGTRLLDIGDGWENGRVTRELRRRSHDNLNYRLRRQTGQVILTSRLASRKCSCK